MIGSKKACRLYFHNSIVRDNKTRVNDYFHRVNFRLLPDRTVILHVKKTFLRNQTAIFGVLFVNNISGESYLVDESTLIRHAANGDAAAWESLMHAHQQSVFRFAYLLLGDPDDAEDTAQESFLRAWKYLKRFDPTRPLRPWLLSITANLASNRRRSAGRYFAAVLRAFRDEPTSVRIEEKSAQNLEANELWHAVQHLNPADQQIIYLRYFLDLSVNETAQVLNVADGTVKSKLSRALEKLRTIIQKDFPVLTEGREG